MSSLNKSFTAARRINRSKTLSANSSSLELDRSLSAFQPTKTSSPKIISIRSIHPKFPIANNEENSSLFKQLQSSFLSRFSSSQKAKKITRRSRSVASSTSCVCSNSFCSGCNSSCSLCKDYTCGSSCYCKENHSDGIPKSFQQDFCSFINKPKT